MALGRQGERQGDLVVTWKEMPRSPGHVFYDRLQGVLIDAGCDVFAETACQPYYAAKMGAPSIPPGRYFRMHMVGYFEGINSERGSEGRADRGGCLDDGGQRRAADDRSPGDRRDLPRDAEAHGRRERGRDTVGRRPRSSRSPAGARSCPTRTG